MHNIHIYQYNKSMLRIKRECSSDEFICGFVIEHTDDLLLIHRFHDFYSEGFSVIRRCDIEEIIYSEPEKFFENIIKSENILDFAHYENIVPITNLNVLLNYFIINKIIIVIQCEFLTDENNMFYIGLPIELGEKTLVFREFDECGKWNNKLKHIKIDNITLIEYNTPYIKYFSKYIC